VFKKTIKTNGELINEYIINPFGFNLQDNISKWGGNFIQDHPNCTFVELEETFYNIIKQTKMMNIFN
jgi:hypothetical protein